MKIKVINIGKADKTLAETVISDGFLVKDNPILLAQVIKAHRSKNQTARANTLDRSQVSGGGKKPWKQKGTGRARAGSSRSPLWRSGGVTFGPSKVNNFTLLLPKKMRQLATKIAISEKITSKRMYALQFVKDVKRPEFLKSMHEHIEAGKRVLLILDNEPDMYKLTRNIPYVQNIGVNSINTFDVLKNHYILWSLKAIKTYFEAPAGSSPHPAALSGAKSLRSSSASLGAKGDV
jgi:large subunit ribosomal protein L4